MASPAQRIASFDELYQAIQALPPGLTGEILEPGVIRTMGRPGGAHRYSARAILRSLNGDDAWDGGDGWWFEQEAEIRFLQIRLAVPDISAWRVGAGRPLPPAFVLENPITQRPDFCCELLSESTKKSYREIKVPLHAAAGVEWLWLVDPEAHIVEILRTQAGTVETVDTVAGAVRRPIPPFSSVVDTSRWWVTSVEG